MKERGDTVVEVLIAVSILGAVLGGAAVLTNRNIKTNIATQEYLTAQKLADQQIEMMRVAVVTNNSLTSKNGPYCLKAADIYNSTALQNLPPSSCRLDASGNTLNDTTTVPAYVVRIDKDNNVPLSTDAAEGVRLHVNVTWESAYGNTNGNIDTYAEVYVRS